MSQSSMQNCYREPMEGLDTILRESLQMRLQHFIEPGHANILNQSIGEASIHHKDELADQSI